MYHWCYEFSKYGISSGSSGSLLIFLFNKCFSSLQMAINCYYIVILVYNDLLVSMK